MRKKEGLGGQKSKGKAPAAPEVADAVNALQQARGFIAKSTSKAPDTSKKVKRVREEEDEEDMATEKAASKLAGEWASEDDYTLEIERRKEETITTLARYESMSAIAKKSLKGHPLDDKLLEIRNKLNNLGETLVAFTKLSDKRYDEIFRDALKEINKGKKPSKKRRMESVPSESEDLNVSDGKPIPLLEFLHMLFFPLHDPDKRGFTYLERMWAL